MWIRKIIRESSQRSRDRKWKSTRKWQQAQRKKRQLEERLGVLRERLAPDQMFNIRGICIGVHVIRSRFRAEEEYRFEFWRKDPKDRALTQDFGERDLEALLKAVRAAITYRKYAASRNGSLSVLTDSGPARS